MKKFRTFLLKMNGWTIYEDQPIKSYLILIGKPDFYSKLLFKELGISRREIEVQIISPKRFLKSPHYQRRSLTIASNERKASKLIRIL